MKGKTVYISEKEFKAICFAKGQVQDQIESGWENDDEYREPYNTLCLLIDKITAKKP